MLIEQPLLAEETYAILHRLLDKADAGRMRLQLKFGVKETPELYDFGAQSQVDLVWDDLKQLEQMGVLELKLKRQRSGSKAYDDGRIDLIYEAESTLREWLQRPGFDPQYHLWSNALNKYSHCFEDEGDALKQAIWSYPGRNYKQLAGAFALIAETLQKPMTLRQLSALCFWGNSKYLDHAEAVIRATFPSLYQNIRSRPMLLPVYLPEQLSGILFIENQDTFLAMVAEAPQALGLVYLGGFRGTAQRVREPGQVIFSFVGAPAVSSREAFDAFWLGHNPIPCHFWGDLDYAGMKILAALTQVFPGMEAWVPGYRPMLNFLQEGMGHIPAAAKKDKQVKPGVIGCDYADYVLMPAIETHQGFVDQELVQMDQILGGLTDSLS